VAGVLRASNKGLQILAAHCDEVSAGLVAATPSPSVGLPNQATSGAVGTCYAGLDGVITVLAGRAQTSAVKVTAAGTEFAVTDSAGAQQVADIGASVTQV
jgi:hypothetical protein